MATYQLLDFIGKPQLMRLVSRTPTSSFLAFLIECGDSWIFDYVQVSAIVRIRFLQRDGIRG